MRRKEYPLEQLGRVRAERADAAKRSLGSAVGVRERAQRQRLEAEEQDRRAQEGAQITRGEVRAALERGELRAADLMQQDAWEQRMREEQAARTRGVEQARTAEERARSDEEKARQAALTRKVEAEVVERDRERWRAREQRRLEVQEEEESAETFASRRPPGRSR